MQQPQINFDISQTQGVVCEECNNIHFQQVLVIRKASGLLTGTGKPTYVPIPVFACTKCGHVNSEFFTEGSTGFRLTFYFYIHISRGTFGPLFCLTIYY